MDCGQIVGNCGQIVSRLWADCEQIVVRLWSDCGQIVVRLWLDCPLSESTQQVHLASPLGESTW